MRKNIFRFLLVKLCALISISAHAFEEFIVQDIRLEGLQRISIGTVFNYLPIKVGDKINEKLTTQSIHSLYKTGFFKDIKIERDGDVLVVFVAERPALSKIEVEGNSELPSESLEKSFKQIGLTEGKVFDRSILDTVIQELKRQYFSIGKYAVKIDADIIPQDRNRVAVKIKIAEGDAALINLFNIVGNEEYEIDDLRKNLELGEPGFFGRNDYSKQLLAADLEILKSYYQDRGFINFNINSTQVALTPDKKDVYITVSVTEGDKYIINDVQLSGIFVVPKEELEKLLIIQKGEIFSRKNVTKSRTNITDRLAEDGYAFANVNVVPAINEKDKKVDLAFYIDPGRRIYVRRINVVGNIKTRDEVIRREVRQMEGDWLSSKHVATSRARLNRLGFFEDVTVETPLVPGTTDQVDVIFTVKERATGTLTAGLGYSDGQGAILNFSLQQNNFVGTGKSVGVNFSHSDVVQNYSFNINEPYYTLDGISRGFALYKNKFDAQDANISNYTTNTYGGSVSFGIPLSELSRFNISSSYENKKIITGSDIAQNMADFIAAKGDIYDVLKINSNWTYDSRNRSIFADEGTKISFGTEVTVPGSDLEYYKFFMDYNTYFPFSEKTTLLYQLDLGYAKSFGDSPILPPFENYYTGGSRSVRGYEANSLGPRDALNRAEGGNKKINTSLELILPSIFDGDSKNLRTSIFYDAGNVFAENQSVDLGELRTSVGVALIWITPVGIMRFSLANPLNDKPGDDTKSFQFTLGSTF